jgi:hypothetical protein
VELMLVRERVQDGYVQALHTKHVKEGGAFGSVSAADTYAHLVSHCTSTAIDFNQSRLQL